MVPMSHAPGPNLRYPQLFKDTPWIHTCNKPQLPEDAPWIHTCDIPSCLNMSSARFTRSLLARIHADAALNSVASLCRPLSSSGQDIGFDPLGSGEDIGFDPIEFNDRVSLVQELAHC